MLLKSALEQLSLMSVDKVELRVPPIANYNNNFRT